MYLKEETGTVVVPADLKQTFENKFTLNIGKNEIIKMKANNVLTDRDLKVAKFLFQFTFATAKQIHDYLGEESTETNLKGRLDKLVKYRILNKFMLGPFEDDRVHDDAYQIYCLDLGGKYLLAHYSNEDTTDWYSTVNMKSSEIISKALLTTRFYIRLQQSLGSRLIHFKSEPELRVGKKNVTPSFEFCIKDGMQKRYFVGEALRDYDFPVHFREKATKLEQLLATNAWKKYYYESEAEPVLFVFAGDEQTAREASRMLTETTEIARFRLSTDERIERELHALGAFMRYNHEIDALEEVIAAMFKPVST